MKNIRDYCFKTTVTTNPQVGFLLLAQCNRGKAIQKVSSSNYYTVLLNESSKGFRNIWVGIYRKISLKSDESETISFK